MVTKTQAVTLNYLIRRFCLRRNLSENTRAYYATMLRNFEWYTRKEGWPEPHEITRAQSHFPVTSLTRTVLSTK